LAWVNIQNVLKIFCAVLNTSLCRGTFGVSCTKVSCRSTHRRNYTGSF
jgi:hypothetical protein